MRHTKLMFVGILATVIIGCAATPPPVDVSTLSPEEYAEYLERGNYTFKEICRMTGEIHSGIYDFDVQEQTWENFKKATKIYFERRGFDANYCGMPEYYAYRAKYDIEEYNIDTLHVTTEKLKADNCTSGGVYKIILQGIISPDSSFAMEKILKRSPHCRNSKGEVMVATTVQLRSDGGYLVDGYKLGRSLRKAGSVTRIKSNASCASSCAVAFLGGKERIVEDRGSVIFHAPYFSGKNAYEERTIDCDIPKSDLRILNNYFVEMVGRESGDRLYERTMWYCSATDGWVITGGSAAELFDIATQK